MLPPITIIYYNLCKAFHLVMEEFNYVRLEDLNFFWGAVIMLKRVGVVGIVIKNPEIVVDKVNSIISGFRHIIIGRMGIPRPEEQVGVIALIIEGTTDEIGALTGKLGNLPGVTVKSALTANK